MNEANKAGRRSINYIGAYYHALEQKGRLAIPSLFRKEMGSQAVITRGLDGCLFLFDTKVFEEKLRRIGEGSILGKDAREWIRLMTHNASKVEFDSQGRILISEHLRKLADLKKECVVAGMMDRVEIWQREKYERYMEGLESKAEEVAERLAEGGK